MKGSTSRYILLFAVLLIVVALLLALYLGVAAKLVGILKQKLI